MAHTPPTSKIGIVGFTASRADAPWDDDSWSLYGCNNLHKFVGWEKCVGWFDLHSLATVREDAEHVEWLVEGKLPVLMWDPQPEWPNSFEYPRRDVFATFEGWRGGRYFTNSISWMTAWAIMHLLDQPNAELGVWGVDMAQGTEYAAQRPSCEYWLGVAEALGIRLSIPQTSDLLKSAGLYGADDNSEFVAKLDARSRELQERMEGLTQQRAQIQQAEAEIVAQMNQIQGARESNDYIRGVWVQPLGSRDGKDPVEEGVAAGG